MKKILSIVALLATTVLGLGQRAVSYNPNTGGLTVPTPAILRPALQLGYINVKDSPYLATGDGVADDTAEIQAAATAAGATGVLFFPPGTYKTTGTITVLGNVSGVGAKLMYTGSGTALQVGNGTILNHATLWLPSVEYSSGTWGTEVGVRVTNTQRSEIHVALIQGFGGGGLVVYGQGAGTFYNTFFIGHLYDNQVNLEIDADATGASNENTYIGGQYSHPSARGPELAGTRHVLIKGPTNTPNNNRWYGACFEGDVPEFHVECYGKQNFFTECRWETVLPITPKVKFTGANADGNIINRGFYSDQIVFTQTSAASYDNQLISSRQQLINTGDPVGLFVLQSASDGNPLLTGLAGGNDVFAQNPTTDYCFSFAASQSLWKAKTDTNPRILLDNNQGRLHFGDGTANPSTYLRGDAANDRIVCSGYFTSGGIGVGAVPSATFRIRSALSTDAPLVSDIQNINAGTSATARLQVQSDAGSGYVEMRSMAHPSFPGKLVLFSPTAANGTVISTGGAGDPMEVWINGTERFEVTDAGAEVTGDLVVSGAISGDGANLTSLGAANITGTFGSISLTGTLEREGAQILIATTSGGTVIDTSKARSERTITADTVFTFSTPPPTGSQFSVALTADTVDRAITIPSSYSFEAGGAVTAFTQRANQHVLLVFIRLASSYQVLGIPVADFLGSTITLAEGGSTATPAAATAKVYVKADGLFYGKDDAGTETTLSNVAGGGAPTTATYITQTADAGLSAEQAMGALATGIVKNTTTTGVQSIAVAGTDYVAPGGALGTPSSGTGTNITGIPPGNITGTAAILGANTFAGAQNVGANAINFGTTANDSMIKHSGTNREFSLRNGDDTLYNYLRFRGAAIYSAANLQTGIDFNSPGIVTLGGSNIGWAASGSSATGGPDTGLNRNAAGVVEVNNGTLGTFRDLKLRSLTATGIIASTATTPAALGAAATTLAVTSNVATVTGDAGGNTLATITGGASGMVLVLIFADALVTITDDASGTANTVNLSAAWTGSANDTLTLVHNGTSWRETARSVN